MTQKLVQLSVVGARQASGPAEIATSPGGNGSGETDGLRLALRRALARARYAKRKAAEGKPVKPWLGAPRRDDVGLANQARAKKLRLRALEKQERRVMLAAAEAHEAGLRGAGASLVSSVISEPLIHAGACGYPSDPLLDDFDQYAAPIGQAIGDAPCRDTEVVAAPSDVSQVSWSPAGNCPSRILVENFNAVMRGQPNVVRISNVDRFLAHKDCRSLEARWSECIGRSDGGGLLSPYSTTEEGIAAWLKLFQTLTESDFLMGRLPRGAGHASWKFSLRSLVAPRMFARVLDGQFCGPLLQSGAESSPSFLRRFLESYPEHRRGDEHSVASFWFANDLEQHGDAVISGLRAWLRSDQWAQDGGRYVPNASTFLSRRTYESTPRSSGRGASESIVSRPVSGWSGSPRDSGDWRYLSFGAGYWIASSGAVVMLSDLKDAERLRPRTAAFMREMMDHGAPVVIARRDLHEFIERKIRVKEGFLDPLHLGDPDFTSLYAWAENKLGSPAAWANRSRGAT